MIVQPPSAYAEDREDGYLVQARTEVQIERHEATSERFLQHASDWYEKADLPQASEKAWGAVAHYLKAVAKSRDWSNSSHGDLGRDSGRPGAGDG